MKKMILLFLSMFVLFSLFGCQKNNNSNNDNGNNTNTNNGNDGTNNDDDNGNNDNNDNNDDGGTNGNDQDSNALLKYELLDDNTYGVSINKYDNEESINVPAFYNEIEVTKVMDEGFKRCTNMFNIYLTNHIKVIGENAFTGCFVLNTIFYDGNREEWSHIDYTKAKLKKGLFINCNDRAFYYGEPYSEGPSEYARVDGNEYFAIGEWTNWETARYGDPENGGNAVITNMMRPTNIEELKSLVGENLANQIKEKNPKYLYMIELSFGQYNGAWVTKAKVDGQVYEFDASFAFKLVYSEYENEALFWPNTRLIPNPVVANVENLTPETLFMPPWQEATDDDGFNWTNETLCIGPAGAYYVILLDYNQFIVDGSYNYGMALALKEENIVPGVVWKQEIKWRFDDHSFGVVGQINGEDNWIYDINIPMNDEGVGELELDLIEGDNFKVRADGEFNIVWGSNGRRDGMENFMITEDGRYRITLSFIDDEEGIVTLEKIVS